MATNKKSLKQLHKRMNMAIFNTQEVNRKTSDGIFFEVKLKESISYSILPKDETEFIEKISRSASNNYKDDPKFGFTIRSISERKADFGISTAVDWDNAFVDAHRRDERFKKYVFSMLSFVLIALIEISISFLFHSNNHFTGGIVLIILIVIALKLYSKIIN